MCFVMVFIATANWKIPDQSSKKDTNNFHELCFSVLIVDFQQVLLHWESIYKNKKKVTKNIFCLVLGLPVVEGRRTRLKILFTFCENKGN